MGQIATLVAVALLIAQLIGFWLMVSEREHQGYAQASAMAVGRLVGAVGADREGRLDDPGSAGHHISHMLGRRIRVENSNPITPDMDSDSVLATRAATLLREEGLPVMTVVAGVGDMKVGPRARRRLEMTGVVPSEKRRSMIIAAQVANDRWLVSSAPMPGMPYRALAMLIAQTALIYAALLLAVLWLGRRISRPLRELRVAAEGFRGAPSDQPLVEEGPSDIRSLTAAFNAMRQRMSGMLTEKDHMLGAIGHDLRTPLAALRVRIESVEDDNNRERMAATVTEMNRMLDDILSLARLGRSSEALSTTDINALANAVAADFEDLGQPVVVMDNSDRPVAEIRPGLMRRAIRNLIENALKYGGNANVSVGQVGREIAIHVDDDGPGIATDKLGEVTEPFARLEASRNRGSGGIGLGLALARGIIEAHHGRLELSNRSKGGLRATLWMPS